MECAFKAFEKKRMKRFVLIIAGILIQSVLIAQNSPQVDFTLYLVGDCGEPSVRDAPIGKVLRREVEKSGKKSMALYLGDNVYPRGLPDVGHIGRERGEEILKAQADWVRGLGVRGIFIPGNHDWQHWSRNGWEYVANQQAFLDSLHDDFITLLPRDGCPGPVEIPIGNTAVLIIIDTQWVLHAYDKPGEESECYAKDPAALMIMLDDALVRNRGKRVIIAGHHPVISYGDHGGIFTWQDHLFPLVDLRPNLYIPMPVIGSLYPFYRNVFGHSQDIKHPSYKQFSNLIQSTLAQHPGSLYVAGHEHALEHIQKDSVHYIVSGSGSKTNYVKQGKYADYAQGVKGFVKVELFSNGRSRLEFWQVDKDLPDGKVVYTSDLVTVRSLRPRKDEVFEPRKGTVKARASMQYRAGRSRELLLGANYRDAWEKEIEIPVFHLSSEKGGLKVLQKGGGQQTLSLRLADSTGREYVIRSIEKYPEGAVPEMFRKTFAQDLVQDQISASHPYAALIVPPLASAAGIYHTNPRIVFVGDDPALGMYRKDFANRLALFEERPADDWSDKAYFGNSKNIVNTSKVLEKLKKDSETRIDQDFVARCRIFDIWIGDWDRHDDQWRWAEIEKDGKKTYRPIPRDRDQAFFVNEGTAAKIWSRKWALPKFEGFDEHVNWPSGLSFNARFFDRTFLNELKEEDWITQAKELQRLLTDSVIESAVKRWPKEIYELNGEEIVKRLKARRAELVEYAMSHYKFLARQVDVVGSDKKEIFEVKRKEDGDVEIDVYKINKKGEKDKVYDRTFKHKETKEIIIYGQGEEDQFIVTGSSKGNMLVRIVGGSGRDSIVDKSNARGLAKRTLFYDNRGVNAMVSGGELRDETSKDPYVNLYNRKGFKYNRLAPLIFGNFNPDDGLFIGGGFLYQTEGFRKNPFDQRHIFLASIAPRTNSYNFLYRADFTDVFGRWGLAIDADIKAPNYVNNFFGMGNETKFDRTIDDNPDYNVDEEIDYYRFRFEENSLDFFLTRRIAGNSQFRIGPSIQRIEVEEPGERDRYIGDVFAPELGYNLFKQESRFTGVTADFILDNRNNPRLTTRGAYLWMSGKTMKGIDGHANDFMSIGGSLAFYHSFNSPRWLTFAVRAGAGKTFGNYNFYQAQILSGRTDLRGYRKTRFYGDSKLFTNVEVRAKLASIRTYLFPATIGVLAFHDLGRVWFEDDEGIDPSAGGESSMYHRGIGGGIWFTPFNMSVLSVELGHSSESTLGYVRLGFLF
jgi:hypothetical protein